MAKGKRLVYVPEDLLEGVIEALRREGVLVVVWLCV